MKQGWEIKKLGEVVDIINGRNQSAVISDNGQYPIYGSAGNLMGLATDYLCEEGTTIIGRKGNISNPIYIEEKFWNVDTAFGLYPKNGYSTKFINYLCQTIDFKSRNRGTTIPSLVKSDLLTIDIPFISSLPEQQRIVSILDEAFAAIAKAKTNAEQNLKNAKELFESYLQGVFENGNWETKTLNQISENLDSKRIPITKNKRKSGDIPYYGASGIVDYVADYLFDEDLLCVSEDGANLLARTYPIAFSISGKTWVNNHAHVLKFPNIITQKFVEVYINSIRIDDYVSGMAQPKLNQAMLNKIPIPVPLLEEQQAIVRHLDALRAETQKLEAVYQKKITNLEELKKSILQKAFAGELKNEKAILV
ncbi:MAG: restriction endonuclease subunit S [Bacteroidales bacterium]|nr:restriction endonuclease subunit S [Bacteroidales bacterium]